MPDWAPNLLRKLRDLLRGNQSDSLVDKIFSLSKMAEVRKALVADAERLTQIAQESKRYWGYPEHWLEYWRSDLSISPDLIQHHCVYVGEVEGTIVGFYALVTRGEKLELDHLWVVPEQIGKGIGKLLFLHAMDIARQQRYSEIGIVSDPHAEGFYRKMGAARVGEEFSEVDGQERCLPRMNVDLDSQ